MRTVFEAASEIAAGQGALGDSPAQRTPDGRLLLCAASCVIEAALSVRGDQLSVERFRQTILGADSEAVLPPLFRHVGLDPVLALTLIRENDKRRGGDRLSWFVTRMGSSADESTDQCPVSRPEVGLSSNAGATTVRG